MYFCEFIMWKNKSCSFEENFYTLPRIIELCFIGKIIENVKKTFNKNFEITNIFYWSDSEIFICWIQSIEKGWEQRVENRVNFIRNFADYKSWYYASRNVNPADLPTRNSDIKCLQKKKKNCSGMIQKFDLKKVRIGHCRSLILMKNL